MPCHYNIMRIAFITVFIINSLFVFGCNEQTKEQTLEQKIVTASESKTIYKILVVNNNLHKKSSQKTINAFVSMLKTIYPATYNVVHWSEYSEQLAMSQKTDLLILSPQAVPWQNYPQIELERLKKELKKTRLPMIGICGGCQLIALFNGGELKPIEPRGHKCRYPSSYDNCKREKGYLKISLINDSIFKGLNGTAIVWLNHVEEITKLPEGFKIIASNETTKIQAMKSDDGLYYGFQFHPEHIDATHQDGAVIFKNAINCILTR